MIGLLEALNETNLKEVKLRKAAIDLYNDERPQIACPVESGSIGSFIPEAIHQSIKPIKSQKLWKNYYQEQTTFVNPLQDSSNCKLIEEFIN